MDTIWYECPNTKCPIKIHDKCEKESRKKFKIFYKKCEYCRTCKECNKIMKAPRHDALCLVCGGAGESKCIRQDGQTVGNYTCKICREQSVVQ